MIPVLFGLRLGRWGMIGFEAAAFLSILAQTAGFYQIAGNSPSARAAFGASMSALAAQFVALFPTPIRPDTVGGFVEFRGIHPLGILLCVWALVSATGFARGDEERGIVEASLATPTSRAALVASRAAAFTIAIAVASLAACAGYLAGLAIGHETAELRGVLEDGVLLVALGVACYALSIFVAQLVPGRAATAAAGGLLLGLFLLNSLSRVLQSLVAWRWLSPFRYYDLSQPLPPGGTFDARGFLILVAIAVVGTAAAAVAFTRRDLGSSLIPFPARHRPVSFAPSANTLWRVPVVRGLYERRLGIVAWSAGMSLLAFMFVLLTRTIVNVLLSVPSLLPYLSVFVHQQIYPAVLGYTWLNVAQLLFAALAITHVARWSAEDVDGRLEMTLSQPFPRAAVVVERMAVLTVIALVVSAISGTVLFVQSHIQGIDLNAGRLAAASLMLVPFALVFAGAGAVLAAVNPRAAVGLLGAFAFASYLDIELATIFRLPLWLQDLSAFKLFGTPLLTGVDGRSLALMVLLAMLGLGSSILLMQKRDVGR